MPQNEKNGKVKDIKLSEEAHKLLKDYCNEKGLKMFKYLESLIKMHCKKETDIYGDYK